MPRPHPKSANFTGSARQKRHSTIGPLDYRVLSHLGPALHVILHFGVQRKAHGATQNTQNVTQHHKISQVFNQDIEKQRSPPVCFT